MSAFEKLARHLCDDPVEYAVAKGAWNAALEHAAKVCEQHSRDAYVDLIVSGRSYVPVDCAAAIRKEIEK